MGPGRGQAEGRGGPPAPASAELADADGRRDGGHARGDRHGVRGRALVLNASMEPLSVVAARRAVVLVLQAKAEVLHAAGPPCRGGGMEVAVPSVVRLRRFVAVPRRDRVTLTRRGVFARDGGRCQYCGARAENVDHVVPRSRGGAHAWENVVASCRRCNSRKEDRTPREAGMRLARAPVAPRPSLWLVAAVGSLDPDWARYVDGATAAAQAASPARLARPAV